MVLSRRFALALVLAACAPSRAPASSSLTPLTLVDTSGARTSFPADVSRGAPTVVVFYAEHCPCFRVHDERLRRIATDYAPRGVRLILVDSEASAAPARDASAATERGLPAIAIDPGAKLADALGAEYATFAVVFDGRGQVRYRGGIDTDKDRLHDDATSYVREALDDLLAGREPRRAEGKALGCALQKH